MAKGREKSVGAAFQAQTKRTRDDAPVRSERVVPPFKVYANPLEVAALPIPQLRGGKGLWATLATTRESIPEGGRLRLADLSQLLWATAGFTYAGQRTRASAVVAPGIETYVIVRSVEDVFAGVYHYNPREHAIEYLDGRDPAPLLQEALHGDTDQDAVAAVIAYTGIPGRIDEASDGRAYRYLYLEAGAAAQCAVLAAVGLGLVARLRGEFFDDELARGLQVDGTGEFPLCLVTLGT